MTFFPPPETPTRPNLIKLRESPYGLEEPSDFRDEPRRVRLTVFQT